MLLQLKDAETGDVLAQTAESTIIYNKELKDDREFQLVVNTKKDAVSDKSSFMISSKIWEDNPITYGSGPECY